MTEQQERANRFHRERIEGFLRQIKMGLLQGNMEDAEHTLSLARKYLEERNEL